VIVVGELVRNHNPSALATLLGLLVIITFGGRWLVADLRTHPANFPGAGRSRIAHPTSDSRLPKASHHV
jgi:hypothetical protein